MRAAYHPGVSAEARIAALADKARGAQWDLDEVVDWSAPAICPPDLTAAGYVAMLSQLYWAERFAITLCGRLSETLPSDAARAFLETQVADEARHAEAYRRYAERFGPLAPNVPTLDRIYDAVLAWRGSYCLPIVTLNIVFEAEALAQQKKRIEHLPCPLFRALNERILLDETRHAAFGILYMEQEIPRLPASERAAILDALDGWWADWEGAVARKEIPASSERLRTTPEQMARQREQMLAAFARIGLRR